MASVPDIVDLILADHARVRELLGDARVIAAEPGAGHLATIWAALADLLEKHLDAAEEITYPALFNGAARGPTAEIADDDDVRESLGEARLHPAGSSLWWLAVQAARKAVISHLDAMETGPLAAFRWEASPQERDVLGRRWLAFVIARADDSDGAAEC